MKKCFAAVFAAALAFVAASSLQAQALVGAWTFGSTTGDSTVTGGLFVFLANGTYYQLQTGPAEGGGHSGVERGTYTWNPDTGDFVQNPPIVDTNGEWGISNSPSSLNLVVTGDTVSVNGGAYTFSRVTGSDAIVGAWSFGNTTGDANSEGSVLVLLANGTYYEAQTGAAGDGGTSGVERSTYTWNADTGAFTAALPPIVDTNGEWGLSASSGSFNVVVAGDTLSVNGGATVLHRITGTVPPGSATLTASGNGTIQWRRDGVDLVGETSDQLTLNVVQPGDTGIYTAKFTDGDTVTRQYFILGVDSSAKAIGAGEELQPTDIHHPNGNIFDQVLLTGAAETITADPGQITRTSYIDLDDDIVQVEFAGAGTLSLVLDEPTGPALPVNYNQAVNYMKGHAGIVITGADETTNVSVFSVGRATALNQALFKDDVDYDGIADIAFIAIASTDGKFGGLRTANANYFASRGLTGVYAPGVEFVGPVFIGNITASDTAIPAIVLGSASDTRITGGDLHQDYDVAVQVSGVTQLKFADGTDSHGSLIPAQANQARLEEDGVDVTDTIVVNPIP